MQSGFPLSPLRISSKEEGACSNSQHIQHVLPQQTQSRRLCMEAIAAWKVTEHISVFPRILNTTADSLSRVCLINHKWSVQPKYLQGSFWEVGDPSWTSLPHRRWGRHHSFVPLQAAVGPHWEICSRSLDLGTLFYAFPPFPLLSKVSGKLIAEGSDCILIASFWLLQICFFELLHFAGSEYITLPPILDLLIREHILL